MKDCIHTQQSAWTLIGWTWVIFQTEGSSSFKVSIVTALVGEDVTVLMAFLWRVDIFYMLVLEVILRMSGLGSGFSTCLIRVRVDIWDWARICIKRVRNINLF